LAILVVMVGVLLYVVIRGLVKSLEPPPPPWLNYREDPVRAGDLSTQELPGTKTFRTSHLVHPCTLCTPGTLSESNQPVYSASRDFCDYGNACWRSQ
jgi:hypothetical protein